MVFLATNIAYLLAASFLDPKSNYAARRPPLSADQIDRILTPLNLSENTPLLERWWNWLSSILFRWDWGKSPIGEEVIDQIGHRALVSAQLLLLATILPSSSESDLVSTRLPANTRCPTVSGSPLPS